MWSVITASPSPPGSRWSKQVFPKPLTSFTWGLPSLLVASSPAVRGMKQREVVISGKSKAELEQQRRAMMATFSLSLCSAIMPPALWLSRVLRSARMASPLTPLTCLCAGWLQVADFPRGKKGKSKGGKDEKRKEGNQ